MCQGLIQNKKGGGGRGKIHIGAACVATFIPIHTNDLFSKKKKKNPQSNANQNVKPT